MKTLIYDLETNGFLDQLDRIWLLIVGDPETDKVEAYSDFDDDLSPLEEGLERLRQADRVVAHNGINFDSKVFEKLGITGIGWEKNIDTMILSRLRNPSRPGGHSLEVLGEALGVLKGKYEGGFDAYSKEMLTYGLQDGVVTLTLWSRLKYLLEMMPTAVAVEHVFANCMALQMQNGFRLDVPAAMELHSELLHENEEIERELQVIFPPLTIERFSEKTGKRLKDKVEVFNPGSRPQIAKRLTTKYGWKPRVFTKGGGAKVDEAVLSKLRYPEAAALVRYFTAQKKLGQVTGWLEAEKDGRVHGYINTIGANTHRCTHSKPNVAQVDKDHRMRALWIASTGWNLVGCDAEGLELRMLGHYLARYDGGVFWRSVVHGKSSDGTDVHSRNQSHVGLHLRDSAKTFIYALIYGAGDFKLGQVIIEDAKAAGKPKPKGSALALGKAARASIETNIKGLKDLVKAVKTSSGRGWVKGLDGRKVQIRSAHSALNTLLQSAGAILMKHAVRVFWESNKLGHGNSWRFCANVHDEQQFEVIPNCAEKVGKDFADAIRIAGEELGCRCPMGGAFAIGSNWAETH